jgi:hypothetical protein
MLGTVPIIGRVLIGFGCLVLIYWFFTLFQKVRIKGKRGFRGGKNVTTFRFCIVDKQNDRVLENISYGKIRSNFTLCIDDLVYPYQYHDIICLSLCGGHVPSWIRIS